MLDDYKDEDRKEDKMEGWNRIDLHQHTNNEITCNGKNIKSDYTHEKFRELLLTEKVNLKAVTNHNTLNLCDHVKYALICRKLGIGYLPGVEIDYEFCDKKFQAITILNPSYNLVPFSEKLGNIVKNKGNNVFLDKDDFAKLHENIEYIFIPHAMKGDGIYPNKDVTNKEAEDWVMNMIQNGSFFPVIFENTKDYFRYTIYKKIEDYIHNPQFKSNVPCYVGSDFKFDNDEKRKIKAIDRVRYFINAEPTYRGLEIALRNHETRFSHESDLVERTKYITEISLLPNKNFCKIKSIKCSQYLNVIIGESGTGKTLLLNEIYRSIKGKDLSVVSNKNDKSKSKNNAYYSKVGNEKFCNLKFTEDISAENIRVIEIPNIYQEIMKYVTNSEKLGELFGISNRSYIDEELTGFISRCNEYCEYKKDIVDCKKIVTDKLELITGIVDFFALNKIQKGNFELNVAEIDTNQLDAVNNLKKSNAGLYNKKSEIDKYFKQIDKALDYEHTEEVEQILLRYHDLLDHLKKKNETLDLRAHKLKISKRIKELINNSLRGAISKLGQKEKISKEKQELFDNSCTEITDEIKKALRAKKRLESICLVYPYNRINEIIREKNSNEIARFTLSFGIDDLSHVKADNDIVLVRENNKAKIKNLFKDEVDFNNAEQIKILLDKSIDENINISDILNNQLPLSLELRVGDDWKLATNINQGTIAKVSMNYYFRNLIKLEQPDIVFIDQPENDVDKEFLTSTLAEFIKNQKVKSQIFITSHDPILAINADANMVIRASVDSENKIKYEAFPLEYYNGKMYGTDTVANILDGGKNNIDRRYQIYGGIMKHD